MAFRTTRELLNEIRDFHRKLGHFYREAATKVEREKVKALLEYMGRHEENLNRYLESYEKDAAKRVLDTWFQFTPEIVKRGCFDEVAIDPDMSVDDVIRNSLWLDECLTKFFKQVADLSVSSDVKDLFSNLAAMEETEERHAARAAVEALEGD